VSFTASIARLADLSLQMQYRGLVCHVLFSSLKRRAFPPKVAVSTNAVTAIAKERLLLDYNPHRRSEPAFISARTETWIGGICNTH
jgi:hypothetical protein